MENGEPSSPSLSLTNEYYDLANDRKERAIVKRVNR